ncbi:MAG: hypothetical protein MUE55_01475 [Thermoplasmata archaeon]|nr:hypothetical protein [Thermoplasmata archaeon]
MKMGKILKAVGGVIAVIGIFIIAGAVLPADDDFTAQLPGGDYYYVMSYGGLIAGSIDFEFTVSDGSVVVYVFSAEEFATYEETASADPLYTTSGDSGSFTFEVPDTGTYYFVFEHTTAYWMWTQDIEVVTTINGVGVFGLALGAVLIAVGVVVYFYGTKAWKQEQTMVPPGQPAPINVVMFGNEQQRPPAQP